MRSATETAILVATIVKLRAKAKRARISTSTLKVLGGRDRLRSAFVAEVGTALGDFGLSLIELDVGGYAVIETKALEAAPALTAKKRLTAEEMRDLRSGKLRIESFKKRLLA